MEHDADTLQLLIDHCIVGRDREVMLLLSEGKTLTEVGRIFGVTREYIRQIRNRIYTDYPELEGQLGSYRNGHKPYPTKVMQAALKKRDRELIKAFVGEYCKSGKGPEWSKCLMRELGLGAIWHDIPDIKEDTGPREIAEIIKEYYYIHHLGSFIWCLLCKDVLPAMDFSPAIRTHGFSLSGSSRVCRECNRKRVRKYYKNILKYRRFGLDPSIGEEAFEEFMKNKLGHFYMSPEVRSQRMKMASFKRWHKAEAINAHPPAGQ